MRKCLNRKNSGDEIRYLGTDDECFNKLPNLSRIQKTYKDFFPCSGYKFTSPRVFKRFVGLSSINVEIKDNFELRKSPDINGFFPTVACSQATIDVSYSHCFDENVADLLHGYSDYIDITINKYVINLSIKNNQHLIEFNFLSHNNGFCVAIIARK